MTGFLNFYRFVTLSISISVLAKLADCCAPKDALKIGVEMNNGPAYRAELQKQEQEKQKQEQGSTTQQSPSQQCGINYYMATSTNPGSAGIVGGTYAAKNEYPWNARLYILASDGSVYNISATIVSERHLLTTATILKAALIAQASQVTAYFGDLNSQVVEEGEFSIIAEDVTWHPLFNSTTRDYDFAVVRLSRALDFSNWNVKKICLPTSCTDACSTTGTTVYIPGWGYTTASTQSNTASPLLKHTTLAIGDRTTCLLQYQSTTAPITDNKVCAGRLGSATGPFAWDQGAGLIFNNSAKMQLCGMMSYYFNSNIASYYSVYSRICTVLPWLQNIMNQLNQPTPPPAVASTCGHSKYYSSNNVPGSGIVGGAVALPNQFPWAVRLYVVFTNGQTAGCTGSIISERYILTAAHCMVASGLTVSYIRVYIGEHNATATTESGEFYLDAPLANLRPHASFNPTTLANDIALIKLPSTLSFTSWNVQRICLPMSASDGCAVGTVGFVAGWGLFNEQGAKTSEILRYASLPIVDQSTCRSMYGSTFIDSMICAGYSGSGVMSCQGDSGGPFMTFENGYYKLCGNTDFGKACGLQYMGLTRVASFLSWIVQYAV